jgi:hypothetical protein
MTEMLTVRIHFHLVIFLVAAREGRNQLLIDGTGWG